MTRRLIVASAVVLACIAGCESMSPAPSPTPRNDPNSQSGNDPLDPFYVTLGSSNWVQLCVWDHGQIDGDIVHIYWVNESLVVNPGDPNITLPAPAQSLCWQKNLPTGIHVLGMRAVNEGDIPPNTGSMRIEGLDGGTGQTQQWSVNQSAGMEQTVLHVSY